MDVELTGIVGTNEMGLGRLGTHPGKKLIAPLQDFSS